MEEKEILEEILKELKKGSSGTDALGARGPSLDIGAGAPRFDKKAAQAQIDLAKEHKAEMDAQIEAGEKLDRVQRQQYDSITAISEASADNVEGVKELVKNYSKLGTEMKKGASKFKNAEGKMFGLTGAANSLNAVVPTSTKQWTAFGTELVASAKSGELFVAAAAKLFGTMINLAAATDKATAKFAAYSGAVGNGNHLSSKYGKILSKTERSAAVFGATHEDIGAAQSAMFGNYQNYTSLTEKQATALGKQTAALSKLGVSEQLTAQIFDSATKSLGFNDDQLVGLTQTLHDTAISIGKPTQQVAADFGVASKKLAFYGTEVVGVFQNLEKHSKATGLGMSDLIGIAGEAFDTFDGAAEKVGRLNAILGGPYLNSIDMLNASEDERIDMIKASMDASGQMFSDLGKYEKKAIASALGVDVDTASRMFGSLSAAEEIQIRKQEEVAETARKAQEVMAKLTNAFYSLVVAIDWLFTPLTAGVEVFSQFTGWLNEGESAAKKAFKWILNLTVLFGGLWGMLKTGSKTIGKLSRTMSFASKGMRDAGRAANQVFGKGSSVANAGKTVSETGQNLRRMGISGQRMSRRLSKVAGRMDKVAKSIAKPFQALGNAARHPIQAFKRLSDLVKGLPKLLSNIKMPSIKMPAWLSNLSKIKMPSFKMPNLSSASKGLRKVALNFGKIKDTVSKFKMPSFKIPGGGKTLKFLGRILAFFPKLGKLAFKWVGGAAKILYPLELIYHTVMSIKDNFSLFGDSLSGGEGFLEKTLGWIGALLITIGDAAARATDSLVNFGVWIANIFLPENWELPELNLSGMIKDSLANLDFSFVNETFAHMGDAITEGLISVIPRWARRFLGIGKEAKAEKAEVSAIQGAEDRRAKREGREAKKITTEDVDDVMITASGKMIKPHQNDTIIAAKPDGILMKNQEKQQEGFDQMASFAAKAFSPMSSLLSGVTGAVQGQLLGKKGDSQGKGGGSPNVNVDVNVKIGEKQLTDIIIEALSSPEAGKAISPFLN
tara:strand:- start:2928 stop:5954 length:3027 start_codon:yes stop_codon:yes gene_type:complete